MPRVRLSDTRRYPKARPVACLAVALALVPAEYEPGQSDNRCKLLAMQVICDASHLPVRQPCMRRTAGCAHRADRGRIATLAARYAVVASHCIAGRFASRREGSSTQ